MNRLINRFAMKWNKRKNLNKKLVNFFKMKTLKNKSMIMHNKMKIFALKNPLIQKMLVIEILFLK